MKTFLFFLGTTGVTYPNSVDSLDEAVFRLIAQAYYIVRIKFLLSGSILKLNCLQINVCIYSCFLSSLGEPISPDGAGL